MMHYAMTAFAPLDKAPAYFKTWTGGIDKYFHDHAWYTQTGICNDMRSIKTAQAELQNFHGSV